MGKLKERNSNFELMRIVSMLAIILWHIIKHGNMISNSVNPTIDIILNFFLYTVAFHVNSFVLLSGYFQSESNFKLSKFLALIFQVIFYSSLILIIGVKLNVIKEYGITMLVNNLLFSSVSNYWFIKAYIVVYLLSDIINKLINTIKKEEYKAILLCLFVVFSISSFLTGGKFFDNNGYNFYNFVFLYMIGGYFKRYPIRESYYFKKMTDNGYRFLLVFIFFLMVFLNYSINQFAYQIYGDNGIMNEISNRILYSNLSYASPFVIIQTISYFLLFETFNFKNKFINFISSCVFGIYLFHDNRYVRSVIYKVLLIDNGSFAGYSMLLRLLLVLLIIFIIGLIIELIRKLLICILFKVPITNKLVDKIKNFSNSFSFKIRW